MEAPVEKSKLRVQQLYNRLLPPAVAHLVDQEEARFHELAEKLRETWQPGSVASALKTVKLVPVVNSFLKAQSTVALVDVHSVVNLGFEVILDSCVDIHTQTTWAKCLCKLPAKYREKLKLAVAWRPLHDIFLFTHLRRQQFYTGAGLIWDHASAFATLIRRYRRFFPPGSATEIWTHFTPCFDDLNHASCLEAVAFVSLFLPTKTSSEVYVLTSEWFEECLQLWLAMPGCKFWSLQWESLITRCLKDLQLNFEPYLPVLFTRYLNSFTLPVGRSSAHQLYDWRNPNGIAFAFCSSSSSKLAARSIVCLLGPGSAAQAHFEKLVDLLEPYYHPSNGGSWTRSLDNFLHFLVLYFLERVTKPSPTQSPPTQLPTRVLGPSERAAFVKTVLRLVERGQYSKNEGLGNACAHAVTLLSYVEPALALPLTVSSFKTAMKSITATHQLEHALKTVALCCHPLVLSKHAMADGDFATFLGSSWATLENAMFWTLPGLDANDPPKTNATMQFYCSILSNIDSFGDSELHLLPIDWNRWALEFIDQLFSLLYSLEPGSSSDNHEDTISGNGFLMDSKAYYGTLLKLFFGRLTKQLYEQVLMRIRKFVMGSVLPGAAWELGTLCYAAVENDPATSASHLLEPIMKSLISTLLDSPSTGYVAYLLNPEFSKSALKATLSPALETTATCQLSILSDAFSWNGLGALSCRESLKAVINAAFDAPSSKVNGAAQLLFQNVISSLTCYYLVNNSRSLPWIGLSDKFSDLPNWHVPSSEEIVLVNELVEFHLQGALSILSRISSEQTVECAGQEKDYLRVTMLRLEAVLHGLGSCLPDFDLVGNRSLSVVGSPGATIGDSSLRNRVAQVLHATCRYLLETRGDESVLLKLLISVIDAVVNVGSIGNTSPEWWKSSCKDFTEPSANLISNPEEFCKRRPLWLVYQRVYNQLQMRTSEADYFHYHVNESAPLPPAVELLSYDLLELSLHRYKEVRTYASAVLGHLFRRYPLLIHKTLPSITMNLSDSDANEELALGCCAMLRQQSIMRHMMEDWTCLSSFIPPMLGSAHHDSSKVQDAINEVFFCFNWYFGGLPLRLPVDNVQFTRESMVSHLQEFILGDSVHWRYNLMAQGMLLFLALSPSENGKLECNINLCVHFLSNLTSELPALRPLSVIAVLLLLGESQHDAVRKLLDEDFGSKIVEKLAVDHLYSEGDGLNISSRTLDSELVSLMPMYIRSWPLTRSWESKAFGVAFSTTFAKFFEELTRRYGQPILDMLKQPLQDACRASEEREKQCTAAEIVAGFLRSDSAAVVGMAWENWLRPLLKDALKATTLDSAPEWIACIRYAASTEEGHLPLLRFQLLDTLAALFYSSKTSSLVAKTIRYLNAALTEFCPKKMLPTEVKFHRGLLQKVMEFMTHSSPQVRKAAGTGLCLLCANLRSSSSSQSILEDCTRQLINRAKTAAASLQSENEQRSEVLKEKLGVKEMETVFHFLLTCIKSGRFNVLVDVAVELLHPLLLLQETPEKDLASLAKSALRMFKWQQFPSWIISRTISVILTAASEDNWRVRIAALTFVQPFSYRHCFIMDSSSDWHLLWSKVIELLLDPQLEVREIAAKTLAGLMKGADINTINSFRRQALAKALSIHSSGKSKFADSRQSVATVHGDLLRVAACVLSVPYDVPSWLPEMIAAVAFFNDFPWPVRATVSRTIGEFRRTHSDGWDIQKEQFTEEQLELLLNSGTASYFA